MKKTRIASFILALVMSAAAVSGCTGKPQPSNSPSAEIAVSPGSDTPSTGKTIGIRLANGSGAETQGAVEKAYVDASNAFAAALVNAMGENWTGVVSPLSFGMLLEMLANGASADESVAILKAMLNEMGMEASNENAARLIAALAQPSARSEVAPSKFSVNNAILVNSGDSFNKDFETAIADHFRAFVGNIDFSNTDEALKTINGWVDENTNGLIPQLFDNITPDTTMALINALYFKASWKNPFVTLKSDMDPEGEKLNLFHGANGEQPVSMLTANGVYSYGEFDGDKVVLVPYADDAYYMAVILPADGKAAASALADTVNKFDSCKNTQTYIAMPSIELSTKFDAMPVLDKLGLGDIAKGDALFPSIVEGSNIRLTQFVHAAVIKVNEAGTEAGAASGATGAKGAIIPDPEAQIICNRPYAMAIVHAETNTVLFASVVNEIPSSTGNK